MFHLIFVIGFIFLILFYCSSQSKTMVLILIIATLVGMEIGGFITPLITDEGYIPFPEIGGAVAKNY